MAARPFCGYNALSATKEIPITRFKHSIFVLFGFVLAGCESTTRPIHDYTPRKVVEIEKWQVESDGNLLGQVTKYEIRDPKEPIQFYRVTDTAGRWLGHASDKGRFSRRVPFQEEEQDLGVFAMKRGVALLLEASKPVELKPVAIEADQRPEVTKPR